MPYYVTMLRSSLLFSGKPSLSFCENSFLRDVAIFKLATYRQAYYRQCRTGWTVDDPGFGAWFHKRTQYDMAHNSFSFFRFQLLQYVMCSQRPDYCKVWYTIFTLICCQIQWSMRMNQGWLMIEIKNQLLSYLRHLNSGKGGSWKRNHLIL